MNRLFSLFATALFTAVIGTGCISAEVLTPSDISVEELEKNIQLAMDPQNRYASAKNTVCRQEVTTERWMEDPLVQMVEVKFAKPDLFRWVTYDDNKPVIGIITNGKQCWYADYKEKSVSPVGEDDMKAMQRIRSVAQIADPGSRLKDIFPIIRIYLCKNELGEFYKLECQRDEASDVFNIYVNKKDFRINRISGVFAIGEGSLDYDARILRYRLYEGFFIPAEMEIFQNGEKQTSRVITYRINTEIDPADFRPPVF